MKIRFPHPFVLLLFFVGFAATLTYVLPAGRFERREDAALQRSVVVADSYQRVEQTPVNLWAAVGAIHKGIVSAASIIAVVFLIGGAFSAVERTGALAQLVNSMVRRLANRPLLIIPLTSAFFAMGGFVFGMGEEIIAFAPILILLTDKLGYSRVIAIAVSYGAANLGFAMSSMNPFCVVMGQTIAELPLFSGAGFRALFFVIALALYVLYTMRYAKRTRTAPESLVLGKDEQGADAADNPSATAISKRNVAVLLTVGLAFVVLIAGLSLFGWSIEELAGAFFVMGIAAGVIGGLGVRGTAEAFAKGFSDFASAAMLIGFARAILVVLEQGQVIDTIVAALFAPVANLPVTLSALAMLTVQGLIHLIVPSSSGQAFLTLPILVPLSDLLGLSRQVTVLAYQYGVGVFGLVTPTDGTLLAMIALCDVSYSRWFRFGLATSLLLFAIAAIAVAIAVSIGLK
jgi:uncharacterized ion transporter superfamily protein YfcC